MSRRWGLAAFGLGGAALLWVGQGYVGSSPLALLMTGLIGAVYLCGAWELWRYTQTTQGLAAALAALPQPLDHATGLAEWLQQVPAALRSPVRLRLEGERAGLPGPALAPYLVGLLVLLGMLGTFLGMVVTLKGAVLALESTTDLPTMRAALAAPVKGLGLAFGTSVAGVAASAMLGLVAALCRRERLQTATLLDGRIATSLRSFSRAHQREATLQALQTQAAAMPAVAAQMQAVMDQMAAHNAGLHQQLLASQADFHEQAQARHAALAQAVDHSLQRSLADTARLAAATIEPIAQATLGGLARESAGLQASLLQSLEAQVDALSTRLGASLQAQASALQAAWQQAGAQSLGQQQQICQTLAQTAHAIQAQAEAHARATLAEIAGLLAAVAQAPQAAAELMAQLRQKLSDSLAQDNTQLDERRQLLGGLATLLGSVNQATTEQRLAIDSLVAASAGQLKQAGSRLDQALHSQTELLTLAGAALSGGAVEVASLGEALGLALQQFSDTSQALMVHLQRVEAALDKSALRSDEQLAYYVAQAREIIDLSIGSQQQIVDKLHQLAPRPAFLVSEAA